MTKSTFRGRGGARPGAGRKRKPIEAQSPIAKPSQQSLVDKIQIPDGLNRQQRNEFMLRKLEEREFEIAMGLVEASPTEIAAIRDLRDRISGRPAPAKPKDEEQPEFDDGWDELLSPQKPAARAN